MSSSKMVSFASHADVAVHQSVEFDDGNGVFRRMLDWQQDYSYSIVRVYSFTLFNHKVSPRQKSVNGKRRSLIE